MAALKQKNSFEKITEAVVLAGGLGTRLRSVAPDIPKPMVRIHERPFLDYLLAYLASWRISRVIISTGHMAGQIEEYFGNSRHGLDVLCAREAQPLGTGGAVAFAARHLAPDAMFLALNGDSFAPFNPHLMAKKIAAGADAAIMAVSVGNAERFGALAFDGQGMLSGFDEKNTTATAALINAGIYLLPASWFPRNQEIMPGSIERDYFPRWLEEGKKIAVLTSSGPFIDIGTPETLAAAPEFIRQCGFFKNTPFNCLHECD